MAMNRVVVVGGSMAGLAAAAALAPLADEVVVVERHRPDRGTVAPQGLLPHIMCAAGQRALESLFPGFAERLLATGAETGGPDPVRLPVHWYAAGAVRSHLPVPDLGFPRALCGRALIERQVRERLGVRADVALVRSTVTGPLLEQDRVAGVQLRDAAPVRADLVVDASGRAGAFRDSLAAAGLPEPPTTEVGVDLRYAGFVVERHPGDLDGAELAVVQNTPQLARIGVALPLERGRWQIVLGGYFGDAAPLDPGGARSYAATLADPVLADLLARPLLERPRRYTFRSNLRRHWERVARPARGLVAVGDAVASFNPIYGQGMSSALLQAQALAQTVRTHAGSPGLERRAARAVSRVVDAPWQVSTGGDFVYGATTGRRPRGQRAVGSYLERVMRVSATDDRVNEALTGVQQMLAPPAALFSPDVAARVLRPRTARTSRAAGRVAAAGS